MDIGSIYKSSWKISKEYKRLWIIGMALVLFTGKKSLSFGNAFRSVSDIFTLDERTGADLSSLNSSAGALNVLVEYLTNIATSVSFFVWVLLIISIIVSVVFGIIIGFYIRNWAIGAMIGGIDLSLQNNREATLLEMAQKGRKNVMELFFVNLALSFLNFLVIIVTSFIIIILYMFLIGTLFSSSSLGLVILAYLITLLCVPLILVVFIIIIAVSIIRQLAQRYVVIDNLLAKDAILSGYEMLRKNLGNTLIVSILNQIIKSLVSLSTGIIMVIAIVLAVGAFLISEVLGSIVIFLAVSVIVTLVFGGILIFGIYHVFSYSTWNVLFYELKNKNE